MAAAAPGGPGPGPGAAGSAGSGAAGPAANGAAGAAAKSGEERLKEMEAEMALFEQEVLGAPAPPRGGPADLGRDPPGDPARHPPAPPRPAANHRHQHLPAGPAEPGGSSRRRRHRCHPHGGPTGAIRGPSGVTAAATGSAPGVCATRAAALG
ncbi:RNA-binding protein 42-like [Columba livia]|uniref:RNA-binding protein 42-like n=1 Tax=Columba livia TaxID=8932 RepID=UPI0031BA129A